MTSDRYTRFILAVIAICLVWICVREINVTPAVLAQTDRGREVVKDQIVSIDEAPSLSWEALPVRVR